MTVSRRLGYPLRDIPGQSSPRYNGEMTLRTDPAEDSKILRMNASPPPKAISESDWNSEIGKNDKVEEAFNDIEKLISEFPNHLFWNAAILAQLDNLISSTGLFSGPIASWYQDFYREAYDVRRKVEDMKIADSLQKGKKYQEILFGNDFLVRHVNNNVFYTDEERTRNRKWSIAHKIYFKLLGYKTVDLAKKYAPLTSSLGSGKYDQELKEAWGIGEMTFPDLLGATAMYSRCFSDKVDRPLDESDRRLIESLFEKYTGTVWKQSQALECRREWRRHLTDDTSPIPLIKREKANKIRVYRRQRGDIHN